jgi:hypothetical protein
LKFLQTLTFLNEFLNLIDLVLLQLNFDWSHCLARVY